MKTTTSAAQYGFYLRGRNTYDVVHAASGMVLGSVRGKRQRRAVRAGLSGVSLPCDWQQAAAVVMVVVRAVRGAA